MPEYDISVIVPIYNAEQYLNQCVDSILAQTKKNIEIVLIDDGSTDICPQIIDDYARKNENVVAVHQKNGGLTAARIAGLRHASGKYIGWVDADDFILPNMYERLFNIMQETGADYTYCNYSFYPHKVKGKEKWFKQYHGYVDWNYIERNNQVWNTLSSRSLLDEIKLTELYPLFEEYAWIAVLLNARKTVVVDEPLYYYRVGINSMSGGSFVGKVPKFLKQVEMTSHLHELIDGTQYEKTLKSYFDYREIYTLLQLCVVAAINRDRSNYQYGRNALRQKHFQNNPLVKTILDHNHGQLKSLVLRYLIPSGYYQARLVTGLVYQGR